MSFVVAEDKFCIDVVVGSGGVSLGSACWLAAGGEGDGGVAVGDVVGLRSAGGLEEGGAEEEQEPHFNHFPTFLSHRL